MSAIYFDPSTYSTYPARLPSTVYTLNTKVQFGYEGFTYNCTTEGTTGSGSAPSPSANNLDPYYGYRFSLTDGTVVWTECSGDVEVNWNAPVINFSWIVKTSNYQPIYSPRSNRQQNSTPVFIPHTTTFGGGSSWQFHDPWTWVNEWINGVEPHRFKNPLAQRYDESRTSRMFIISVDKSGPVPPVSMTQGATIKFLGGPSSNSVINYSGYVETHGLNITLDNSDFNFTETYKDSTRYSFSLIVVDSVFSLKSTYNSYGCRVILGSRHSSSDYRGINEYNTRFVRTQFLFDSSNDSICFINSFYAINCDFTANLASPLYPFSTVISETSTVKTYTYIDTAKNQGDVIIARFWGCDFSTLTGAVALFSLGRASARIELYNCKLPPNVPIVNQLRLGTQFDYEVLLTGCSSSTPLDISSYARYSCGSSLEKTLDYYSTTRDEWGQFYSYKVQTDFPLSIYYNNSVVAELTTTLDIGSYFIILEFLINREASDKELFVDLVAHDGYQVCSSLRNPRYPDVLLEESTYAWSSIPTNFLRRKVELPVNITVKSRVKLYVNASAPDLFFYLEPTPKVKRMESYG